MTTGPKLEAKHINMLWAAPEKAAEIAAMHARLFPDAWSVESVATLLDGPASTSFVAQIGLPRITVGFIIGQVAANEAEILSVGVAPELQRRGLGQHLTRGFLRAAERAEAKRIFLEVAEDNAAARRLYENLGFREVTRRAGYYERTGAAAVDALVLQLAL